MDLGHAGSDPPPLVRAATGQRRFCCPIAVDSKPDSALPPREMPSRAADQFAELAGRGIRIRTRALITTLFARLLLGDLFLHGIGGAKYDQVTDAIIERFFGLKPPEYMTVTATLRLPIARPEVTPDDVARIQALLRDQTYHPERHLSIDGDATLTALVERKRQWIATEPTPQNARLRCRNIRAANEQMQPLSRRTAPCTARRAPRPRRLCETRPCYPRASTPSASTPRRSLRG